MEFLGASSVSSTVEIKDARTRLMKVQNLWQSSGFDMAGFPRTQPYGSAVRPVSRISVEQSQTEWDGRRGKPNNSAKFLALGAFSRIAAIPPEPDLPCAWGPLMSSSSESETSSLDGEPVEVQVVQVPPLTEEKLQALRTQVPRDENGEPTSIGSVGHEQGACKPCLFAHAAVGCLNGVACDFCHIPHKRKNLPRPCKGQRDRRFRRFITQVERTMEHDPESLDLGLPQSLPPSVETNQALRIKLIQNLQARAKQVKTQRHTDGRRDEIGFGDSPASASGLVVEHPGKLFCELTQSRISPGGYLPHSA